jgi:hypothetical protein
MRAALEPERSRSGRPSDDTRSTAPFDPPTDGLKKFQDSNYQVASAVFDATAGKDLADYAAYYKGRAVAAGNADARRTSDAVIGRSEWQASLPGWHLEKPRTVRRYGGAVAV